MLKKFKLNAARTAVITAAVVVAVAAGYLFVRAQSVTDTYNNDSKITASWNISTSTSGEIRLAGRDCDIYNWYCAASTTCANYLGDGDFIIVYNQDAPSMMRWKTTNTACDQPQCSIVGGQSGDNLKADNTIDFGSYPARDYCKSIGGRLPTIDELSCIYNNKASFGSFVTSNNYISGTELNAGQFNYIYFTTGGVNPGGKDGDYYLRCVKGW
jgi:hypothetical protein